MEAWTKTGDASEARRLGRRDCDHGRVRVTRRANARASGHWGVSVWDHCRLFRTINVKHQHSVYCDSIQATNRLYRHYNQYNTAKME